jgi:hypothetical protein
MIGSYQAHQLHFVFILRRPAEGRAAKDKYVTRGISARSYQSSLNEDKPRGGANRLNY